MKFYFSLYFSGWLHCLFYMLVCKILWQRVWGKFETRISNFTKFKTAKQSITYYWNARSIKLNRHGLFITDPEWCFRMIYHRVRTEVWHHQIFVFAFQHFHDHISVKHDEKPSHTKFYMNQFMGARDMTAWIPN